MIKDEKSGKSRRKFLKSVGTGLGAISLGGAGAFAGNKIIDSSGEKIKVLTPEGKVVEVDKDALKEVKRETNEKRETAREGLPNRKREHVDTD